MQVTQEPHTEPYFSIFACRNSLAVLRSMSDEVWATVDEIASATPLTREKVQASLDRLEILDLVTRIGNNYRENKDAITSAIQEVTCSLSAPI